MSFSFDKKKILVTGGARGIGADISEFFLNSGAQVYIVGKNQASFDSFVAKNSSHKANLSFLSCDLSQMPQVESLAQKISDLQIDVLVNNAGINKIALAHEVAVEDFDKIQDFNVKVPFILSQAVLPGMMKKKSGKIINIASVFGTQTRSQRVSYTTSKAAIIGMTKTLAVDYAQHGILVNVVSPGFIDTELTRTILSEAEIQKIIQSVPMNRLGKSSEIAKVVGFLASDMNTFMTGQNLVIDGGFSVV